MDNPHLFSVEGHQLAYRTLGAEDGPWVVLLHTGLGSMADWDAQIPALVGAGYCVLVYDRWGYGGSSPRPDFSPPDFSTDVHDLRALLSELDINNAAQVGQSDGATIALLYAAQYPAEAACVVSVAAHIYTELEVAGSIVDLFNAYQHKKSFRRGLAARHGDKTDQLAGNWLQGWMQPQNLDWDLRPDLQTITCPGWVVLGSQDGTATEQQARDTAALFPQVDLWIVPDGGHMLPQEDPGRFNPRLLAFMNTHLPNSIQVPAKDTA